MARDRGRAFRIRAEEVSLDQVSGAGSFEIDPHGLAGDDVALGSGGPADAVVGGGHRHPGHPVAVRGSSGRVHPDPASFDDPAPSRKPDAVKTEASDGQTAHDRPGRSEIQSDRSRAGARTVEGDQGRAGEARLRRAVDRDRIGDRRKSRRGGDRRDSTAGQVEADRVGAGQSVGVQDRLAQRPRSRVGRGRDGERGRERRRRQEAGGQQGAPEGVTGNRLAGALVHVDPEQIETGPLGELDPATEGRPPAGGNAVQRTAVTQMVLG